MTFFEDDDKEQAFTGEQPENASSVQTVTAPQVLPSEENGGAQAEPAIKEEDDEFGEDEFEDEEGEDEESADDDMPPGHGELAPGITLKEGATAPAGKRSKDAAIEAGIDATGKKESKKPKVARKRWYIVHTYSGHENKVKVNLERRIESMGMGEKIFRVEVPQKTVTKIKDNKRYEKDERIFPGYVLVEMIMDDDSWYVVRHTPGVTKFVGSQKKPIPAKDSEIKRILMRNAPTAAGPAAHRVEIDLKVGEVVKIISGPFADFEGTVTEVSPEKERLKASVSIFGRETPVELAFNQVIKSN